MNINKIIAIAGVSLMLLCGCQNSSEQVETTKEDLSAESETILSETSLSKGNKENGAIDPVTDITTVTEITTPNETSEITDAETSNTTAATLVSPDRNTILRNVCWGDTKEILKSVETDEIGDEDDNALTYKTSLANHDAVLLYSLDPDFGLYKAFYSINCTNDAFTAHAAYDAIVESVTAKYGEPTDNSKRTLDHLAEYCSDDNQALKLGYIAYAASWDYTDTNITLMLLDYDYKLNLWLEFECKSFIPPTNTDGL